ncbi:ABC transporter substrate-binding protein, partial [Streptomyces sp. Ru71]
MPRPRRHAVLLVSALCLSLPLTACSSGSFGSGRPGADAGGRLTFALSSDPTCVDPHQAATSDAFYAARGIVDSLTDQDPRT